GYDALDELRLPTITPRRYDAMPGGSVGDLATEVAPDQMQTEVDPGRETGRREDVAVVDEEPVLVELHLRVDAAEQVGPLPVGGRRSVVEQPGRAEHERARTDRRDPGARPDRAERLGEVVRQHALVPRLGDVRAGDDHRACLGQGLGTVVWDHLEPGAGP